MENENIDASRESIKRLQLAEIRAARAKVVMESLAGFCHALGQPATVLLSSVELLRMDDVDAETKKQMVELCYEAVMEIRSLLAEMKQKREYVAEAYLTGKDSGGNIISLPEWREKSPPKASWDK